MYLVVHIFLGMLPAVRSCILPTAVGRPPTAGLAVADPEGVRG